MERMTRGQESGNRSNKAMQPTAGRRTASHYFMKTVPEIFTRALASRG